jgi:hypothetical protein
VPFLVQFSTGFPVRNHTEFGAKIVLILRSQ